MWKDGSTNEHGRTVVNTLHDSYRVLNVLKDGQSSFVSTKGSSTNDILIMSEKLKENKNFTFVDIETELFTGAPKRGHIRVWLNIKKEDRREVNFH